MIPTGTKFIGISPNVNLKEKKSAVLNAETQPYTFDDMRGYKAFTALITQNSGDDTLSIDEGTLTIGVTYLINNDSPGMDFTNVGAPNNDIGTFFVATAENPNSWGSNEGTSNATLTYNIGAPIIKILENTLDARVWFEYDSDGEYLAIFDSYIFFSPNEYVTVNGNYIVPGEIPGSATVQAVPVFYNVLYLSSFVNGVFSNDIIGNVLNNGVTCVLEIRKYE